MSRDTYRDVEGRVTQEQLPMSQSTTSHTNLDIKYTTATFVFTILHVDTLNIA